MLALASASLVPSSTIAPAPAPVQHNITIVSTINIDKPQTEFANRESLVKLITTHAQHILDDSRQIGLKIDHWYTIDR